MSASEYTRRRFLATSTRSAGLVAGLSILPRQAMATLGTHAEPVSSIRDSRIKALAERALQAARDTGAEYADVRLTFTRIRSMQDTYPLIEEEVLHVGVRALVRGYWGFAASPVWHPDEMARLGREAASLAAGNAVGKPRAVDFSPVRPVVDEHWETPVRIDAFAIHPQEIRDFFGGLRERISNDFSRRSRFGTPQDGGADVRGMFKVQEKAFASTDGTYCTQRLHWAWGFAQYASGSTGDLLTFSGAGWEHIKDAPIVETVRQSIDENRELAKLPVKAVDVGRYDTVLDARSVAALLSRTVGAATELDRALGYEANAGGTSYLNDPAAMLGAFPIGNAHLTVTANRREPGGVATTRWDDEGVEPSEVTLIKDGVLHDFQTSREGAGWLREVYAQTGRPFRSHGGVFAPTAGDLPLIHTANLVMQEGRESVTQQDLEATLGKGMVVVGMVPNMDFQCLNGAANQLACYEIKGGKRVARIVLAGVLFRAPELLKSITALGGLASARRFGYGLERDVVKGEPAQYGVHSVTAVPMSVKDLTFVNPTQR